MAVGLRVLGDGAGQGIGKADVRVAGFEASVLKLKLPLKLDVRAAGRVVCSTKRPIFMLCVPLTFVMLPEKLNSVL